MLGDPMTAQAQPHYTAEEIRQVAAAVIARRANQVCHPIV